MRYSRALWMIWLLVLAVGCASQYRTVKQAQVTTVRTTKGEELRIVQEEFVSFEEVIERSPNVKSVTRMTDLKGEKEPNYFVISPTDEELVFQALEEASGTSLINLWKMPTTGGPGMTRLTAGRYFDIEPAFSSDGTQVCFASNRSSTSPKIFTIRADGAGGITRVTQSDSEDRSPCWATPSGVIYYASKPFNSRTWQIWRINVNGALPTQLKEGRWPSVSPDGTRIAYCAVDRASDKLKIWVMNSDGTGETQLTTGTESDDVHPCWSPDGGTLLYASDIGKDSNGKRNFDIWMMTADGASNTQLTTNGSTDLMPTYSPDGKYIYFLSNRGFFWDIWRMEIVD